MQYGWEYMKHIQNISEETQWRAVAWRPQTGDDNKFGLILVEMCSENLLKDRTELLKLGGTY
jgi:hypothetical protein